MWRREGSCQINDFVDVEWSDVLGSLRGVAGTGHRRLDTGVGASCASDGVGKLSERA